MLSVNNYLANKSALAISLQGETVERTNSMKYVGVRSDGSLGFKDHVNYFTAKDRKGLAAIKIMAQANLEKHLLVLLYQVLVFSVTEYALGVLTLSPM